MRHLPARLYAAMFPSALMMALIAGAAPARAQTPLLANGDFQNGFTAWQVAAPFTSVLSQPYDGYSGLGGSTYALLGPVGADGSLTQTITDTPGAALTLHFELASDGGLANDFTAEFNGNTLLSLANIPLETWQSYTFAAVATGSDRLTFLFRDDPGYLALDQVSVTQSVPEPPAIGEFLLGVGLVVAARRQKHRR